MDISEMSESQSSVSNEYILISSRLSSLNIYNDESEVHPCPLIEYIDVENVYPTGCDLICRYRITNDCKPLEGDVIAVCNLSDTNIDSSVAHVPAYSPSVSLHANPYTYSVKFAAETLPGVSSKQFKFSYFRMNNVIKSSEPFTFGNPEECGNMVEVEDPDDPGLVVFKSKEEILLEKIAKIQEEKEKAEEKLAFNQATIKHFQHHIEKLTEDFTNLILHNDTLVTSNIELKKNVSDITEGESSEMKAAILENKIDVMQLSDAEPKVDNETKYLLDKIKMVKTFLQELSNIAAYNINKNDSQDKCIYGHTVLQPSSNRNENQKHHENVDVSNESSNELELSQSSECILKTEIDDLKEKNAYLKSRIEVLELELRSKNEEHEKSKKKYNDETVKGNLVFKEEISGFHKLSSQNTDRLETHFKDNDLEAMHNIISIKDVLRKTLLENELLGKEIVKLRKECVGRVSVWGVQSQDKSHQEPSAPCTSSEASDINKVNSQGKHFLGKKYVECYYCGKSTHISRNCRVFRN